MESELTEFRQDVSGGFMWREAFPFAEPRELRRFLVQKPSIAPARSYSPLREKRGLFRTFALDLEISEEAIEAFAHQYGSLGSPISETLLQDAFAQGESLQQWRVEIITLRCLVKIWDAARHKGLNVLQKYIHWRGLDDVFFDSGDEFSDRRSFSIIASQTKMPDVFATFTRGDVLGPAIWYLQQAVNDQLKKKGVGAQLLWDSGLRSLRLHIVPVSLIGCIWLQFAKAIEGEKEYRQCGNCLGWIEVGGGRASRSDKRFCSPTCKATAHRKKREKARELALRGATARAIASELGADVRKVKGWIKS